MVEARRLVGDEFIEVAAVVVVLNLAIEELAEAAALE